MRMAIRYTPGSEVPVVRIIEVVKTAVVIVELHINGVEADRVDNA